MFEFFKKNSRVIDVNVEGNKGVIAKRNKWLIPVMAIAVCILLFGNFGGRKNEKAEQKPVEKGEYSITTYIQQSENRLTQILSGIKGAGNVRVMMNFDVMGEKILAKNKTDSQETRMTDQGTESNSSDEENILLYDSGGEEKPYVVKEKFPEPSGIFVIATGASNERVRLEMYEAVKALYGLSGHRIRITASSN